MKSEPRLSVVICTYNRDSLLQNCIQSLVDQKANQSLFEVIVINNNSTDNTVAVAKMFRKNIINFKIVTEKKVGLSNARNRGVLESKGEWIAFVDDDGMVRSDFVDLTIYTIDHYDFGCFGGSIDENSENLPKWFKYKFYPRTGETTKEGVNELKTTCFFGGIAIFKKELLKKHKFNPELGMIGHKVGYSEESDLQRRLRAHGVKVGYNPVIVLHHPPAKHKARVIWFIKSAYASGKNYWLSHKIYVIFFMVIFWKIFINILKNIITLPVKIIRGGYYWQNCIIDIFYIPAYHTGRLVSAIRIIGSKDNN